MIAPVRKQKPFTEHMLNYSTVAVEGLVVAWRKRVFGKQLSQA